MRKGRQTPTQSYILPYQKTLGSDAIELYNSTGRTAQEWQELMLADIMAFNEDDLFVHTKYGYCVPRRNGKNEVVAIREMWGLKNGEHILHTAHRTTTTHVAWERLCDLLQNAGVKVKSSYKAFGKEHIKLADGGTIEFRTRTSKGGLGEGYDLLVIDEAQEYQDDQESALKYVVSDSQNPQTIFCGTPPTLTSSGTVFTKYRENTLSGKNKNSGWAEWGVEKQTDPHDKESWYETNPSLGTILTERKIEDEITGDDVDFNIQRLGYWFKYNLKSDITEADWEKVRVNSLPKFKGKLFVGVKYGHDGTNVSMSIAVKTSTDKVFVEAIDCRSIRAGNDWIISFLKKADVQSVVVDGANGQSILVRDMKDFKLKAPMLPTVKEAIESNAIFEKSLFGETLCHNNQPSLAQIVTNCQKRAIGTNGGFGYNSLKDDSDISLMDSMVLAHWACMTYKERKKQKVSY